jgi:hypothetical protein
MSYYSDASLVLIPSGYKNQKVYSAKPTDGSGDLTFTRASDATRVDSNGLIEKVRTNLAPYSSDFSQQYILIDATISTNTTTDPFGTSLADSHLETATSSTHTGFTDYTVTSGAELSYSIYAKSIGGRNIRVGGSVGWASVAVVDLSNGTLLGGSTADAKVTSVGNGWYRISITATTSGTIARVLVYSLDGTTTSFAGDVTKGIHIFGRQLEYGVPTDYIPTTTAAVSVGPVSGLPRLDYSGGATCGKLLLEPQRTNVITFSEQINNATWNNVRGTITANSTISPSGVQDADTFASAPAQSFPPALTRNPTYTGNTSYTLSIFAKVLGNTNLFSLGYVDNATGYTGGSAVYNLATQVITITQSPNVSVTASMQAYGNGWYRLSLSFLTIAVPTFNYFQIGQTTNDVANGFALWGCQLEAGSYATSYIPTLGSAVTRLTDTYQKGGFGNTSTAGTLYYELENYQRSLPANGMYIIQLFAGSSVGNPSFCDSNSISIINNIAIEGRNNGYATTLFNFSPTAGATVKIALRYDGTNVVAFINGVKGTVFADTAVGVKNAIRVNNGENGANATKQLLIFSSALTDAQCIELTTL